MIKNGKLANPKTEFKNRNEEFWIGNRNSKLNISLITNPSCGYCKEAIQSLKKIGWILKKSCG
jgi:protein-disulfide isomerase